MSEVLNRFRTQKLLSFTLIVFTLAIGIVIGTLINVNAGVKAAKDQSVAPGATPLVIPNEGEIQNAFTQIAKAVEPSVVNISTTYNPKPARTGRGRRTMQPDDQDQDGNGNGNGDNDGNGGNGGMDEFLYRFFGNPFGGGGNGGSPDMPQGHKGYALGSGVVVDRAGYILTNNHVVDKADRIQVKFAGDPTEYDAKVVGVDAPTDLAVIRVEGKHELTPAKIGNSDAVQVGDWSIAIGSPFGFDETVTAGIISAKGRDVDPTMQFQHFLQTDAAINPGNSGGPLLNIRGEVIGINTAIASRSGSNAGIGFALPINTAAEVYNSIIKNGRVTRGGIGVSFVPSDTDRARALLKVPSASTRAYSCRPWFRAGRPTRPASKRRHHCVHQRQTRTRRQPDAGHRSQQSDGYRGSMSTRSATAPTRISRWWWATWRRSSPSSSAPAVRTRALRRKAKRPVSACRSRTSPTASGRPWA